MSGTTTTFEARVETCPPRRVAYMRHVGPYQSVGPTFQKMMAFAGRHGLFGPGTVVMGVCWDDPSNTPTEKLRYDCCVTVGEDFKPVEDVGVETIEGGEYAVARLRGPYEKLGELYNWLYGTWLPTSGRQERHGPTYEVYRNSPADTAPENLITEIYVPLKPKV